MKLKFDDNKHVITKDGKPVYVDSDGQEVAFDVPGAMAKISQLNAEAAKHRRSAKEYKDQLSSFEDIDPDKAREALKIVESLDQKKLVDAGKVEELKTKLSADFNREKTKLQDQVAERDKQLRKLAISNQFAQSEFISKKTFLVPDIAESAFGGNFSVETTSDGATKVVGQLNGSDIYSRENPGEIASFEEAISIIINAHPQKTAFLRGASNSGSGGGGNFNGGGGGGENPFKTGNVTEQAKIVREDPARARQLATAAGKTIAGLNS